MQRKLATAALVTGFVLVFVITVSMTAAHDRARLEATATVEDVTVENESVTGFTVRIRNDGATAISPVFHVESANWSVPNAWPATGPENVAPGKTAAYKVTAPAPETRPVASREFVVRIGDRGEQSWVVLRYSVEGS